jgi:hypothetical protein
MEVSIQAVSPELGEHLAVTAFFGSGSLAQAGVGAGAGAGAAAGAAGAAPGAGVWAYDVLYVARLRNRLSRTPRARAASPAREDFFNVMV